MANKADATWHPFDSRENAERGAVMAYTLSGNRPNYVPDIVLAKSVLEYIDVTDQDNGVYRVNLNGEELRDDIFNAVEVAIFERYMVDNIMLTDAITDDIIEILKEKAL